MSDFALAFDPRSGGFDLCPAAPDGNGLALENGLRTAVLASLLTWGRAHDDDPLPDFSGDRRGWWGDSWPHRANDRIGSRLWTFRAVNNEATRRRAVAVARQSLQWLVEDDLASAVEVMAETPTPNRLELTVIVHRPDGSVFRLAGVDPFFQST